MTSKVAGEHAESNSYPTPIPLAAESRVGVFTGAYHGNHQRWLQSLNAKVRTVPAHRDRRP